MSLNPGQLMSDVEKGAERLEKAADQYSEAVERFETAEEGYEMAMAKARTIADHASLNDPDIKKLPSKERRQDIALTTVQREQPEVYTEFFAAKAHKEALAVRYRALSAAVSARQSLLRALQGT
jgi:hypothetical protein